MESSFERFCEIACMVFRKIYLEIAHRLAKVLWYSTYHIEISRFSENPKRVEDSDIYMYGGHKTYASII